MADLNRVTLLGRVVRDLELKSTTTGKSVCSISVVTNRYKKTGDTSENVAEYTDCVAFGVTAENAAKILKNGARVYVEGRIQTKTWDDKTSGQKRYKTEVMLDNFIALTPKQEGQVHEAYDQHEADISISELPF
jgi:single-strand DNA-binding protein